ncbi:MAG: hypothetical protein H3C43_07325 [Leptonema sp. (in: Bacteria)]|nr:hypothetical protein [Leptonema sp. (in: bacteria)]
MSRILTTLLIITMTILVSNCNLLETKKTPSTGAVTYVNSIPNNCTTTTGIKQKVVKKVTSESELRQHYGLTFKVRFNDQVSPTLYGALYYQDNKQNLYCMALPDGRFATFHDSQISENKKNIIQEVCYPLSDCS